MLDDCVAYLNIRQYNHYAGKRLLSVATPRRVMYLLTFLLLSLVVSGVIPVSSVQCPSNSVIDSLDILFPKEGTWVEPTLFIKIAAEVYNVTDVRERNKKYTLCVGLLGDETCRLSVFDEFRLEFKAPGEAVISVSFCTESMVCFCHVRRKVHCCLNESTVADHNMQKRKESIQRVKLWESKLKPIYSSEAGRMSPWSCSGRKDIRTVIGIKSAALHLPQREMLRSTWMTSFGSRWETHGVCAMFIIGNSDVDDIFSSLFLEHDLYMDTLLGSEIPVADSYHTLVDKSLKFMTWVVNLFPDMEYVVMSDDDVYIVMDRLMVSLKQAPTERLYTGEVYSDALKHEMKPQRHPSHPNYLPHSAYPLSVLPSFATGNLYIMSGDLIRYIVRNRDALRPTGDLEDVTMAVWMMGLQVFPKHNDQIQPYTSAVETIRAALEETKENCGDNIPLMGVYMVKSKEQFQHLHSAFTASYETGSPYFSSARCQNSDALMVAVYLSSLDDTSANRHALSWANSADECTVVEFVSEAVDGDADFFNAISNSACALRILPSIDFHTEEWRHYFSGIDVFVIPLCFPLEQRCLDLTWGATSLVTSFAGPLTALDVSNPGLMESVDGKSSIAGLLSAVMTTSLTATNTNATHVLDAILVAERDEFVRYLVDSEVSMACVVSVDSVGAVKELLRVSNTHPFCAPDTSDFGVHTFRYLYHQFSCRRTPQSLRVGPNIKVGSLITVKLSHKQMWVSSGAAYAVGVLEHLFSRCFPSTVVDVFLFSHDQKGGEIRVTAPYANVAGTASAPDILVFSTLDCQSFVPGSTVHQWPRECSEWIVSIQKYFSNRPKVIVVNGEPVQYGGGLEPLRSCGSMVLILNCFTDSSHFPLQRGFNIPFLRFSYLSNAATSFGEMQSPRFSPESLLNSRSREWAIQQLSSKSRSVAYMYYRCDRPEREKIFRILSADNSLDGVDALGACHGTGERDTPHDNPNKHINDRFSSDYLASAVNSYRHYKFVVAFENTILDGYITEKLTNAYLAGAVPIYYGARNVNLYFSEDSMINCNTFSSLQLCADYISEVNSNDALYLSLLMSSPFINSTQWCRFFQWHPDTHTRCSHKFISNSVLDLRNALKTKA